MSRRILTLLLAAGPLAAPAAAQKVTGRVLGAPLEKIQVELTSLTPDFRQVVRPLQGEPEGTVEPQDARADFSPQSSSWLLASGSISLPCEDAERKDNEQVDACHKHSQAVSALLFAGLPTNKCGTEEGYGYDALNVSCEECSPVENRPEADEYRSEHGDGEAGLVQSRRDHVQTTQDEQGWREQGQPNGPLGIETLGLGVHEIADSHPDDHGEESEGNLCSVHEMSTL